MKNLVKKLSNRKKSILISYFVIITFYIISFYIFTNTILKLSGIETVIRYSLLIFFIIYFVIYFFVNLIKIIEKKNKFFIISSLITVILSLLFIILSVYINKFYTGLSLFSDREYVLYKTYLLTEKGNEFSEEDKVGMIEHTNDIEGFVLPSELLEKKKLNNEVIHYGDYLTMIQDLKEGLIDSIFLQGNYINLYQNEEIYDNLKDDLIIVFEHSKKMKNQNLINRSSKDFKDPLSFLIIGVDSEHDGLNANASFNGDVLMVLTFNPKTFNTTMLSLPRDANVPITCQGNNISKINASAGGGTKCTLDTVEKLLDIKLDYYVKINFKGVVDLVDSLGGVEVDVEKPIINKYGNNKVCEQDSKRKTGKNLICMTPGVQTLNGEQALAYMRNRTQYHNDFDRNNHQQQVIKALTKKASKIRSVKEFEKILNSINKNIAINMTIDDILSSYNVLKKIMGNKGLIIEPMKLKTYSVSSYTPDGYKPKTRLSAEGYYQDSLDEIIDSIKANLGLKKPSLIKTFSFKKGEEFKEYVVGENKTNVKSYIRYTVQFKKTKEQALEYCNLHNLRCSFETVEAGHPKFSPYVNEGFIAGESVHPLAFIHEINEVIYYINGKVQEVIELPPEEPKEDEFIPPVEEVETPDENIDGTEENLDDEVSNE